MANVVEFDTRASVVVSQNTTGTTPFKLILNRQSNFIENRLLYCKEANGGTMPRVLTLSTFGYTIQDSNTLYLYSNDAIQLHLSTNSWTILGGFSPSGGWNCNAPGSNIPFPPSFSTIQSPSNSVIVNPTMNTSQLFVDLRSQSKTLVLPQISSLLVGNPIFFPLFPFYTIKDVYGNSATNPLFLSTTGGDILEASNTCIYATKIDSNYASLDILPNGTNNTWHILNYFNGSISNADSNVPENSTFSISSAITYVDTLNVKKLVLLPETSAVKDATFYIKDLTGNANTNPIYISTQVNDLIEGGLSSIMLTRSFESVRVVSYSTSLYSITLNNPYGVEPYIQR
jgi:hypothetical protein